MSNLPSITTTRKQGQPDLSDLFRQAADFAEQVSRIPILNGNLITGIDLLAGTPLNVAHLLNRRYVGWIITRVNYPGGVAPIYETVANPDETKFVRLACSVRAHPLDLWIF